MRSSESQVTSHKRKEKIFWGRDDQTGDSWLPSETMW